MTDELMFKHLVFKFLVPVYAVIEDGVVTRVVVDDEEGAEPVSMLHNALGHESDRITDDERKIWDKAQSQTWPVWEFGW